LSEAEAERLLAEQLDGRRGGQQTKNSMNLKQKNILLLVSVCLFCGVLGSGVWFWWKQYQLAKVREVTEKALKAFPILMADPERGWKNRPNGEMFSGETFPLRESPPFRMNSDESQILISEPSGVALEKTLWIIGDSSPFGLGANAEKTFASRLARTLAPSRVSVRNFSVIGYDSSQMQKYLEILEQRNSSKPDLLILWAGFNDVSKFIHKFFWARPILESVGFQQYKTNVTAILNHLRERKVPVVQVTIPVLEEYPEIDAVNDWIRTRDNRSFDVSVFDIKKLFVSKSDARVYSSFDRGLPYRFHPSNLGHEMIFQELLPLVRQKLSLSR
jgi:lysophospholipase L1-like esterase